MFIQILKRLVLGLGSMLMVVLLILSIIYASPVDPARLSFGQQLDDETLALKKEELGLDKSLITQITYYIRDISPIGMKEVNGDKRIGFKTPYLRESYQSGESVGLLLKRALPNTLILALSSILIASFLGILFGIIAAYNKGRWIDSFLLTISTLGYSIPSYVSAIFFAIVFGFILAPVTGLNMQGGLWELNDLGDEVFIAKNLILPSIALGIRPVSVILQISRSAFLDTMGKPFVLTAMAKGLPSKLIFRNHILKNAFNPIVTSISGWFAALLSGAFFVESVFRFKGIGFVTVQALLNYDVPVLTASILIICMLFISLNILMDILYTYLDPRIQLK